MGAALLVSFASSGRAQASSSVSGTVEDSTGAVIPGAKVLLINEASKAQWAATGNGDGFFSFSAIPAATYTLRISYSGFEAWTVTGIVVHPGDSLTVPKIALKIGRADVSVTVTAERAGISLSSGEHSTMITATDIDRLATQGRDVTELLNVLPGFTINSGTSIQNEGPGGLYGYQTMGPGNSSTLENTGANGAPPQQGLVNLTSDGANVIDPGDMGAQVSNINMSQVQEVKVSTSNFGADQAKGPIVIDAVGKSGSAQFHGSVYGLYRNSALNSNDWLSKHFQSSRPPDLYYYPGATLGGPVLIPHTGFNKNRHLLFWVGYETYRQNQTEGLMTGFVPNAAMLGNPATKTPADLSYATLGKALNVPGDVLSGQVPDSLGNTGGCTTDYSEAPEYTPIGGDCTEPNGALDSSGNQVNGGQLPAADIDPATGVISGLWPAINRVPQPVITNGQTQYLSDGINWTKNVMQSHNGFQLHSRIDESITDTLKLYVVWNWEDVSDEAATNDIYYNPNSVVPYPSPEYSHGHAHYLTLDLTKTFGASLTNDLMVSAVYYSEPKAFANPAKVQTTGTAWASEGYNGGYYHTGTQLPLALTYETAGIPSLAFGYVGPQGEYLKKFDWNISDNLTKVYKTHTFKAGFYTTRTGNSNNTQGSEENGIMSFMRWDGCYPNEYPTGTPPTSAPSSSAGLSNTVGNFLIGCPLSYAQANGDPVQDMRFATIEGYLTDDWKVNSRLTVTLGVRLSHLEPWWDAHGVGMAVWDPSAVSSAFPTGVVQHELYSDSGSNTTWPGINWHKRDPSIPNAGVPTRALFYAPRFGVAYDLLGNGKTVLRGGWGMYYSHDSAGQGGNELATAIGLYTYNTPASTSCTFGQLFTPNTSQLTTTSPGPFKPSTTNPLACGYFANTTTSITPFGVYALDPKDNRMPLTYNYNFTIDEKGPWNSMFEVAYVGNQTSDLATQTATSGTNLTNQDVIPLGAEFGPDPILGQPQSGTVQSPTNITQYADYRPYPNYSYVNVPTHVAWANYNALQASWNRQRGDLVYGANYTYSKSLAVRGNYDTGTISDPIDPHHDYGVTSFSRPQALNFTYSYAEGTKYNGNHLLRQVADNWMVSGVIGLQSGPDLALWQGTNFGLSGTTASAGTTTELPSISGNGWLGSEDYTLQPNVTCDPRRGLKKDQYVNGACFALPAPGNQGWWNLPAVRGPAYFKWDMSVYKDFAISERQKLQFQLSGFNWLNHPLVSFYNQNATTLVLQAGDPIGSTYTSASQAATAATITNSSTFGSTAYKSGVRIVEFGVKYTF